ncbi:MAG TPA: L,D-transpeptidase family protein [Xanthobacteraceae bacterium]|jgi:murein L,D-transpeptidase YcbB/YkuD
MRGLRYDRILAGTAMALVLAMATGADAASTRGTVVVHKPAKVTTAPARTQPTVTPTAIVTTEPTAAPAETGTVPAPPADAAAPAAVTPATPPVAASETVAPDPFASLDPADRPIAEKIRDLLAAKTDKIFVNKKEHAAVEAFYQKRNQAPLWLEKGVIGDRAKAAIARIRAADSDGLDLNDYKIPDFAAAVSADAQAEAELKFTETLLTYARHVQAGRFSYANVSKNIELPQQPPDTAEVLAKLADAADAGKTLNEFSPPQKGYQALKAKLAELRGKSGAATGHEIPDGPELKLLKVPTEDPRVPQLRERLGLKGDAADLHYDAKLVEAVKKYQRSNDLKVTGALDAQTVRDLNGPPRDKQMDIIIANMERWRWIPRDLGKTHVMVNLPDFTLRLMHNGSMMWTTRIVIGKPAMPTPLLTETMKYITVNPTWNVPQSIVQNEYLPALEQDPTVLERMGLKVVRDRDGVHISQPPGDGNALGRLRFNFPNRFDVYQHDTPEKYLFKEERRAYSHGCMRVQDPVKYAQLLLSIERPNEGYTEDRIRRLFGHEEQDIQFPAPIPVHLTYQTAYVEDDGALVMRPDVYGLDSRVLALIRTERGMIDVATKEHDRDAANGATASARRAVKPPPPQSGGFFQALFGGGPPPPVGRPPSRIR